MRFALIAALILSASTWFYVERIMKPQQRAYAAAHNQPRGNLSDLYPRWLGARELLRHGRNPYSKEITGEIQEGYYGRRLNPSFADDPKDQQGFAYPVYVVFLLAPFTGAPFNLVQTGFRWFLIFLTAASVLLWMHVIGWRISFLWKLSLIVLVLGWLPTVQGIKLQQLTLLVAGIAAACVACMTAGWLFWAGALLALTTIKPQLAWLLVAWLLLWAASDWRARRRLVFGFATIMVLLLAGAELILPGWLRMFLEAIRQYHQYTQNESVMVWVFGAILGRLLEGLSILACGVFLWKVRREPASTAAFGQATASVLALTALVVPMFAPYNQVLLMPAMLVLVRSFLGGAILPSVRMANIVAALFVVWPWIAAIGLCLAFRWLTPDARARLYLLPFYSNFEVPIFVFGLMLLDAWLNHGESLRENAASE